ncbi:MAG TPA: DUF2975 domain-containing protein [Clostridia bacterium]|nr:DUF2975 domain-containing protein [Clostridia bacterium]
MAGKRLAAVLHVIIWIMIVIDLLCVFSSPIWINHLRLDTFIRDPLFNYVETVEVGGSYFYLTCLTIYCGVFLALILYQIAVILRSIVLNNPFTVKNAKCFKLAALYSLILWIAFFSKLFISPTLLTLICTGGVLVFALFMFVLSELFAQAASIKEENELTI